MEQNEPRHDYLKEKFGLWMTPKSLSMPRYVEKALPCQILIDRKSNSEGISSISTILGRELIQLLLICFYFLTFKCLVIQIFVGRCVYQCVHRTNVYRSQKSSSDGFPQIYEWYFPG